MPQTSPSSRGLSPLRTKNQVERVQNYEKKFGGYKKMRTFVSAFGKTDSKHTRGAVVQLVRMPACHAGGRGFESLPHRSKRVTQKVIL